MPTSAAQHRALLQQRIRPPSLVPHESLITPCIQPSFNQSIHSINHSFLGSFPLFPTNTRLVLGVHQLLLDLREHIARQRVHVVLLLPSPVLASMAVIQRVRPRVRDRLAAVRLVVDREVRHVLLDVLRQLRGRERHGRDVVHALRQLAAVRLDQLQRATQAIRHVHHGQRGVGAQEARVVVVLDRLVEDIDGVIRRAAAGQRLVRNDAGIAAAAEVQALRAVVVLAEQLQVHLRHAVHRRRTHDRLIGGHLLGGRGTERADRGRNVQTALVLASHLDDVLRTVHVHLQSLLGHLLTDRGQQSAQMNDPGDSVLGHKAGHVVLVSDIQIGGGTRGLELSVRETEIRSNDVLNTVLLTEN